MWKVRPVSVRVSVRLPDSCRDDSVRPVSVRVRSMTFPIAYLVRCLHTLVLHIDVLPDTWCGKPSHASRSPGVTHDLFGRSSAVPQEGERGPDEAEPTLHGFPASIQPGPERGVRKRDRGPVT